MSKRIWIECRRSTPVFKFYQLFFKKLHTRDLMAIKDSTPQAIFRWKPMCWLRVSGGDASNFLQGQFTNDLRLLDKSAAVYGLWLTVKGKVLADSFVLRGGAPDEFWIGSYFSSSDTIRERLE